MHSVPMTHVENVFPASKKPSAEYSGSSQSVTNNSETIFEKKKNKAVITNFNLGKEDLQTKEFYNSNRHYKSQNNINIYMFVTYSIISCIFNHYNWEMNFAPAVFKFSYFLMFGLSEGENVQKKNSVRNIYIIYVSLGPTQNIIF